MIYTFTPNNLDTQTAIDLANVAAIFVHARAYDQSPVRVIELTLETGRTFQVGLPEAEVKQLLGNWQKTRYPVKVLDCPKSEIESLMTFIGHLCYSEAGAWILRSKLYQDLLQWLDEHGMRRITPTRFDELMGALGYQTERRSDGVYILGLAPQPINQATEQS